MQSSLHFYSHFSHRQHKRVEECGLPSHHVFAKRNAVQQLQARRGLVVRQVHMGPQGCGRVGDVDGVAVHLKERKKERAKERAKERKGE